jgi:putative transposase
MPRRQRLQVAGLPVHIIQRGNNRQACFFADEDYLFFLDHLARIAKRFRCALHAYVLMANHFHLLLTSELPSGPSLLMKFLGQRYVQYVNRAYKRTGSLWEGRFRSSLVQTERYVLGCYRYIEMNPVRANIRDLGWVGPPQHFDPLKYDRLLGVVQTLRGPFSGPIRAL